MHLSTAYLRTSVVLALTGTVAAMPLIVGRADPHPDSLPPSANTQPTSPESSVHMHSNPLPSSPRESLSTPAPNVHLDSSPSSSNTHVSPSEHANNHSPDMSQVNVDMLRNAVRDSDTTLHSLDSIISVIEGHENPTLMVEFSSPDPTHPRTHNPTAELVAAARKAVTDWLEMGLREVSNSHVTGTHIKFKEGSKPYPDGDLIRYTLHAGDMQYQGVVLNGHHDLGLMHDKDPKEPNRDFSHEQMVELQILDYLLVHLSDEQIAKLNIFNEDCPHCTHSARSPVHSY
ncbi:hypothetical protein FB446DRAFT_350617 [Lentinula raphanica]|nr:hypothetical protein FB446DRAFT_350617 [Lentinula raphanica]